MVSATFKTISHLFATELKELYPATESVQFARMFFEHHFGFRSVDFIIRQDEPVAENHQQKLEETIRRLQKGEPIQYILGYAWFYNLKMLVSPAVLIPRPETEELVDWVVKSCKTPAPSILDIGTGSGCIPVALKHSLPQAKVFGCDISEDALTIAWANSQMNDTPIEFFQTDILSPDIPMPAQSLDMVVSNPPYVTRSEMAKMHINVLQNEPHRALFVEDDDPLVFYRVIAHKAMTMLKSGGELFFEINEALGQQTAELLGQLGYMNIELRSDINGRHRMVKASKM